MNRKILYPVLFVLVLPLLLLFIWFFPGFVLPHTVATPDYANLKYPVAPVSTPQVEPIKSLPGVVVVDYSHTNQFQTTEIQTLVDALGQYGAQVELNSDSTKLDGQLKNASAYVVISPSASFGPDEIQIIQAFIARGGRMAVFTDPTRGEVIYDGNGNPTGNNSDANFVNPLLEPYGITTNGDYLYNLVENEGNFRNVYFDSFQKSDLTQGLKKIVLYGAHSIETTSGAALLIGNNTTFSSLTDAVPGNDTQKDWAAAALSKDGNVLAIGDFTFLMPPYNTVADNGLLINNITSFLLTGKRTLELSEFPYIFNGTAVDVLPTSNVQMTADLLGGLSRLQKSFSLANTDITLVEKAIPGHNLIVLGTYSPSTDLSTYTDPFHITLDDFSEFVDVSGFGKVGRNGNGVLLFSTGSGGNTLVLLADTETDLASLMDTLSSGTLSGCVLQRKIAVCSIGAGGTFSVETPTPLLPAKTSPNTPGGTPGG